MTEQRWDVLDMEPGTIQADFEEDGVRVLVMRGPSVLCAYVGCPDSHPLAGFDYDKIPLRCHGGLTFGQVGDDEPRPKGYYWYGWDYSHFGDCATYFEHDARKWTLADVKDEARWVAWDFKLLMDLAGELTARALGWRGAIKQG